MDKVHSCYVFPGVKLNAFKDSQDESYYVSIAITLWRLSFTADIRWGRENADG